MTHSELQAKKKCNRSPELERTSTSDTFILRLVWAVGPGRCCGKKKAESGVRGFSKFPGKVQKDRIKIFRKLWIPEEKGGYLFDMIPLFTR